MRKLLSLGLPLPVNLSSLLSVPIVGPLLLAILA
jgi:hypothetical protein